LKRRKKPVGVFIDSMGDLFDTEIRGDDIAAILACIEESSQHVFYCLTKQAQRLKYFSNWPPNLWLGVTVNTIKDLWRINELKKINCRVRFISFEPLYEDVSDKVDLEGIDWVIVGGETCNGKTTFIPEQEWIENLYDLADVSGTTVFCKDNLEPPCGWEKGLNEVRREFPKV